MGNASAKMDDGDAVAGGMSGSFYGPPPPTSSSPSAFMIAPQVPIAPLVGPTEASPPVFSQVKGSHGYPDIMMNESGGCSDTPAQNGIPTLITWSYGGNEVVVEGSWDNWTSKKALHKSGKDHSILLVLPCGVHYYKLIVDGDLKHVPDAPSITDQSGQICNILDVNGIIPENTTSVKEFECPPSPTMSYACSFPDVEEYAKDPPMLPPQLNPTCLGSPDYSAETESSARTRPQHVVLDHLFIEKGWASHSLVALGVTHRYQEKYVTVVLYKPM